jgi:hypothetical protein
MLDFVLMEINMRILRALVYRFWAIALVPAGSPPAAAIAA